MIRLDRKRVTAPATWSDAVDKALPDRSAYYSEARRFESLSINDSRRRDGFAQFAPRVLKMRKAKPSFPCIWSVAKERLAEMSYHKCAYCEGEISSARCGQVDHFRPKALFPSLAYDWDNFFLTCGGCNGAKADKWPHSGGYLRPDRQDPTRHLCFLKDGTVEPVKTCSAADRTIQDFDLKRRWLVIRRRKHIELTLGRLKGALDIYTDSHELGYRLAQDEFLRLVDPSNAYSAALRQCFVREWNSACPDALL